MRTVAIIPALDEEATIEAVVTAVRRSGIDQIVVVDNGSTDRTAQRAVDAGARVVREGRRGYGAACLRGIASLPADAEVVVFLDADGSDDPGDVTRVLEPVRRGADLCVGSRTLGGAAPGALTPAQRFGNRLAGWLLGRLYGHACTDLGPLRAIRVDALRRLGMRDRGFGWTVEMQARAALAGLQVREVSVCYRPRAGGRSKISGTVRGSVQAGATILWTLAALRLEAARR